MRFAPLLAIVLLGAACDGSGPPTSQQGSPAGAIGAVLDDFHDAAAKADEARYFAHFTPNGVFLGTDPAERWTVEAFRAYAHERFATGKGWTYVPSARHVDLSPDGTFAWFDEVVTNETYGACRGTGAVVRLGGQWKLAQYSLSLPLPNDAFRDIAAQVKAFAAAPAAAR